MSYEEKRKLLEEALHRAFGIEPPWIVAYRKAMQEANV
jgi:hypothetical protein